MAYFPNTLQFGDNGSIDGNSRFRVVNPETLYASSFTYSTSSKDWTISCSATPATSLIYLPNEAGIQLVVDTVSGSHSTFQTRQYMRALSGKSYNLIFSFNFGAAVANVTKRIGFFDNDNGGFIEQDLTGTINVVVRSKISGVVVDYRIAQSFWNKDKMNGTGASGYNLDFTKLQAFSLDSFWPSGRVRMGFRVGGMRYTAHEFYATNNLTGPNITKPQLPLRAQIINMDTSAGDSMKFYHASVRIEGGIQEPGRIFSSGSSGVKSCAIATLTPICSFRPKQMYKGQVNRGAAFLKCSNILVEDNSCLYQLIYSGTLTNPTWTDVGSESMMEFDLKASAVTGGEILEYGYAAGSATSKANIKTSTELDFHTEKRPICLSDASGTLNAGTVVTLACMGIGGAANVAASLAWEEFK